ncbi:unnamed protein product [Caenorhabditis bovis]|uniref:Uncharacterized protein n=1 Tax=Caenorhabditis bovis TaxID=2654633 RepID=A0A8S1EU59_9PELO|nr:unnamed protein product [Caenorhabditis bovis]
MCSSNSILAFLFVFVIAAKALSAVQIEKMSMVETLKCLKYLKSKGKQVYVGYAGASNIIGLYDADGIKVSCDETEQQRIREKTDRRCIFSPIHCLFNKRINNAKLLAKPPTVHHHLSNILYPSRRK